MSRAPGARELLLTVLGEFVLPDGAPAWTATLVAALDALGVEARSARQAVARTAAAGLLSPTRVGRATRWSLTDAGRELLTSGAARIYGFGRDRPPWDGRWLLVQVSVPEGDRHLRHALRTRFGWLGLASTAPGVWLGPWADREADVHAVLVELGLAAAARIWRAEAGAGATPETVAAATWDLAALAARYRSFLDGPAAATPDGDRDAFAALVALVNVWRAVPAVDPDLPDELLPPGWPRSPAADAFVARRADWTQAAWRWWTGTGAARPATGATGGPGRNGTPGGEA